MANKAAALRQLESTNASLFFARVPPSSSRIVSDIVNKPEGAIRFRLNAPRISIHCEECRGERNFDCKEDGTKLDADAVEIFAHYVCSNCGHGRKTYAIILTVNTDDPELTIAIKVGEWTPYGPPTSPKLQRLLQNDLSLLRKARQAESLAMGIGSLAYVYRVIRRNYSQFIDELIKAARELEVSAETVKLLEQAKDDQQSSDLAEKLQDKLPEGLMIAGENPVVLLQRCRTLGLYSGSDEDSLNQAQSARLILSEFADHMAAIVEKRPALRKAVKHMTTSTLRRESVEGESLALKEAERAPDPHAQEVAEKEDVE